jgi:phosphoglycolate phosphatase
MKYKIVIFDMDGTILNTMEDLRNCVNYALRQSGYPERTMDEVRCFVGNGLHKLVERAVPQGTDDEVVEKVFTDLKAYYREHCTDCTRTYDGIPELLVKLREMGVKTAVVSNKADYAVQQLVKVYFDGLFDMSVGEREGINKKPAPDSVYEVLKTLGFEKSESIYIGDSEVDVATARNAGIDSIIVEWGFRDRPYLEEQGAKVFAKTPEEVYEILLNA